MRSKTKKSISRLVGIWTFLLLLIFKGLFPKSAYAFRSSLDACAARPECAAAIGSELAPAVSAPTGAGFGASTLSTTTAVGGTSSSVQAVAGVAVVAGISGVVGWHYWNQGQNEKAQNKAKQKYCAANPSDAICAGSWIFSGNGVWPGDCSKQDAVYIENSISEPQFIPINDFGFNEFGSCSAVKVLVDGERYGGVGYAYFPGTETKVRINEKEWKDWPQEKRDEAVRLLNDSDWQGLISSMPEGGVLNPGDRINAPTIVIPGEETDDPNTPADERLLKKEFGFFTFPGNPDFDKDGIPDNSDPDDDNDGTPDTSDPEPYNPSVPTASGGSPNEDTPSKGEQAVNQVRESYEDFIEKPENASYGERLNAIEQKYKRAAAMEDEATTDPDVGYEQDRLLAEADREMQQLENEIGEAWQASLTSSERQLFNVDRRTQAEIDEIQRLMKDWDKGTYDSVADSVLDHSLRKNYSDPLEFLRDASRFDKSKADRIPREGVGERGTVKWEIRNTGEFRIETPNGKIVTYGFNEY